MQVLQSGRFLSYCPFPVTVFCRDDGSGHQQAFKFPESDLCLILGKHHQRVDEIPSSLRTSVFIGFKKEDHLVYGTLQMACTSSITEVEMFEVKRNHHGGVWIGKKREFDVDHLTQDTFIIVTEDVADELKRIGKSKGVFSPDRNSAIYDSSDPSKIIGYGALVCCDEELMRKWNGKVV